MSSSLNDPTVYYRISSDLYGINVRLHDGYNPTAPNALSLDEVSYSSENWQVFSQDNVYFLRNYDYGAQYQLGIDQTISATQPQLLRSSGVLSQQWNMTLWPDGTRKLTNMAIGEFQVLGVSNTSEGLIIPVMNTAEQGSHWTFDINSSAGDTSEVMQAPLSSVATLSSTTTSAPQSTRSSIGSTPSSATAAVTASTTTPATGPVLTASANSSSKLSSGAYAGIAVGAVALIAIIILAVFFVLRRRRRPNLPYKDIPPPETTLSEKNRTNGQPPVEMTSDRPPVELPTERNSQFVDRPSEMPS